MVVGKLAISTGEVVVLLVHKPRVVQTAQLSGSGKQDTGNAAMASARKFGQGLADSAAQVANSDATSTPVDPRCRAVTAIL